ncbi:DMT family transporter [Lichenibacterium dinghuense]|uniref:DMT family transporter n=1 Tax=Lichenibacterium dinghuense TaxID=2895977 RepID=UPI001F1BC962|nr:DMT family transporter [Lichenibacterium sp. 6Y81]
MNAVLFAATVLIWGTTWIAIAFEVGPVPVLVSVFYRFAAAAAILLVALAATGRLRVPPRRDQPFVLAQALCLFCCNFICFYAAAGRLPSGLISVVFSLSTIFNAVGARVFFGAPITGRTVGAAALGVAGLALLFGRDAAAGLSGDAPTGLGLALLGTLFFSLGNMLSRRNSAAGVTPVTATAWGMLYGALALLGLVALTRTPVVAPPDARYVAALLYLAAVGSVVGFTAYLSLVARIGSTKAAYATVLFPVVALALSTVFEGYRWHWTGFVGLALTLAGNVVVFTGAAPRAPSPAAPALVPRPR